MLAEETIGRTVAAFVVESKMALIRFTDNTWIKISYTCDGLTDYTQPTVSELRKMGVTLTPEQEELEQRQCEMTRQYQENRDQAEYTRLKQKYGVI